MVRALLLFAAALVAGCSAPVVRPDAPPEESSDDGSARTLVSFLGAVDAGDFDTAYRLLSGRWRARLTPERLQDDLWEGGAVARDRLARARMAAGGPAIREDGEARFPIGGGKAVRLVWEGNAWKVDALE